MTSSENKGPRGAGAENRPPFGLSRLIDPIDLETFRELYLEKQPLYVKRQDPHYYADILTLTDVDEILSASSLLTTDIRLVENGREISLSDLFPNEAEGRANGLEALYESYRNGATVNLMFLHERWPPLKRVCQSLAAELTVGVHGNVYLTPAGAQGLQPHHDTHDVFVLQLYGTKHWRLYEPQTRLPLQSQLYRHTGEDPEVVTRELDLSPGDLMYLPRGTVHAATANEAASLHLTIGVVPVVWASLLRKAVDQAVAEDSRFREALPMGFALDETTRKEAKERLSGLFDDLRGALSADAVVEEAARTVLRRRQPALLGHLQDLEAVGAIDVTTPLRRRPGLLWHLAREGEQVMLTFHGKVVSFPAHVEDELNFLGTVDEFTGAGIPGALDEAGRMVLTRRLLREGFLTLA